MKEFKCMAIQTDKLKLMYLKKTFLYLDKIKIVGNEH